MENGSSKLSAILNINNDIEDEDFPDIDSGNHDEQDFSKGLRHREIMLLQAVFEKYGKRFGPDVTSKTLIEGFLGTSQGTDKINEKSQDFSNQGALDIDTNDISNHMYNDEAKLKGGNIIERAKYIPLRLNLKERKLLRLCKAALDVSEYTDKVDIIMWKSKNSRIHEQIRDICAILSGLAIASNYQEGKKLLENSEFKDNSEYFSMIFEIGRRHKILNPERMRTDYGKLIHMLMDSQAQELQQLLEFSLVKKIETVHKFLSKRDALGLLNHADAVIATTAISDQRDVTAKNAAIKRLIKEFSSSKLSSDEIEMCLYSISDNSAFLYYNRDPIDIMIDHLRRDFPENLADNDARSLAIQAGFMGARLSHGHKKQYQFVLQTLTLWREIQNDMFKLWCLAEEDLLDASNYYSLRNTGQGLHRVQAAPRIGRAMYEILHRAQKQIGSWVGSSVVHLGDHNVPNAMTFIDKYTQVPRILNPIVKVIEAIPDISCDSNMANMIISSHQSIEGCRLDILQDFFKHAFDGSGADNFYDAGSCIDGRLTSAWNWCNKLDKKKYYSIFKLAGFTGFDGDFKN